jgi:hypothetical protein
MTRNPFVAILLVVVGIIMLLPGGCVLHTVSVSGWPTQGWRFVPLLYLSIGATYFLAAVCLAISAGGVVLLLYLFVKAMDRSM